MKTEKNFLPEALYRTSTLPEYVDPFSPIIGKAIRFDTKSHEIIVDLGNGITGVIPEEEVSIYRFTFPDNQTIPYQISKILGKKIRAIVTGVNRNGNIVLSRKRSMLELWELLQPGMIVDAIVTDVYKHGIFIDIGNGLISFVYIANCSYTHYQDLTLWFKPGYHTLVKIIDKDDDNYRVTVSRKEAYPTLEDDSSNVEKDSVVSVKISRKLPEGYFCEFTPGISGIIDTEQELKEGEIVKGIVKKITPKGLRLRSFK